MISSVLRLNARLFKRQIRSLRSALNVGKKLHFALKRENIESFRRRTQILNSVTSMKTRLVGIRNGREMRSNFSRNTLFPTPSDVVGSTGLSIGSR